MDLERVSTGVPGLDGVLDGGIPEGTATLVTGDTGAGKTTFCLQFLRAGMEDGETVLFITTEQLAEDIREDAAHFDWDVADYGDQFNIIYIDPSTRSDHISEAIWKVVDDVEPDRVVIDSLSVIGDYWDGEAPGQIRSSIHHLIRDFRERDMTAVLTAEIPAGESGQLSRHGVAEFVADAIIRLNGLSLGESTFRSLKVIKMRRTRVPEDLFGLNLTDQGLIVEEEERFS